MARVKMGFIVIVAVFLAQGMVRGELYRWVDEKGVVHFDEGRPVKSGSAVKVAPVPEHGTTSQKGQEPELNSGKPEEIQGGGPDGVLESKETRLPKVELYVTSWCVYCRMAADFLKSKGVPFKSYDIENDREAALRRMRLDPSSGVPFAVINGFRIRGFSVEAYEKALAHEEE